MVVTRNRDSTPEARSPSRIPITPQPVPAPPPVRDPAHPERTHTPHLATTGPRGYLNATTESSAAGAVISAGLSRQRMAVLKWAGFAARLIDLAMTASRQFMVLRARRIWGILGGRLKRSACCQEWREENQVPIFVQRMVKEWRPNGR